MTLCVLALCVGGAQADIMAAYCGAEGTPPMTVKLGADGSLRADRRRPRRSGRVPG